MSMHKPRFVLIAGVWLVTAAAANAAAETAPATGALEEVIVTAQKRSESEQTVPHVHHDVQLGGLAAEGDQQLL